MKKVRISVFSLIFMLALAGGAFAQWQETRITGDGAYPSTPKLWQDTVYWRDQRSYQSGYEEIRAWDPTNGERAVAQIPMYSLLESVHQHTILYQTYVSGNNYDLYLWDSVLGHKPVTTAAGAQYNADIYGETPVVVWEDHRNPSLSQIYIWDEVSGERPLSPSNSNQTNPRIWGQTVAWEDDRRPGIYGHQDVYRYDLSTGEEHVVAYDSGSPTVYDGRIVGSRIGYDVGYDYPDEWALWEWTPEDGLSILQNGISFGHTDVWGDLIVAAQGKAWDSVHGLTSYSLGNQYADYPSVYGNQVAYVRDYNIYLSTLVPEPSSLVALGCMAGGLFGMVLRRRAC